jgi:hypothetical protein
MDAVSRPLAHLALQLPYWKYSKRSIDCVQQILEEVERELVSILLLFIRTAALTRQQRRFGETMWHDKNVWDNRQVGRDTD